MEKFIYISAAGHSGSTLLDMLIGSHSRVASLGEVNQLSKNIALNSKCSCGEKLRSCVLWGAVIKEIGKIRGFDLETDPYVFHLGYPIASTVVDQRHQTRLYLLKRRFVLAMQYMELRHNGHWFEALHRTSLSAVQNSVLVYREVMRVLKIDGVVDSSKSYVGAIKLYQEFPEQTYIILLTRDGRGVMWSNMKRGVSREKAVHDWRNRYTRSIPLLRRYVSERHVIPIRYEDLVADTVGVLRHLCGRVGIAFEGEMLDFRRKIHHVTNGNRMRLQSSSEIKADVEWRDGLSSGDLAYFESRVGTVNRELGYP